jgi:small subunit ribosomal protein S8
MSLNDPLANVLSKIDNAVNVGKSEVIVNNSSKLIKNVLSLMKNEGYIGEFEEIVDSKGNSLKINLVGNLNRCGVIKPRFAVKTDNFEKFEKRFLLAKGFGLIIVSTTEGLMNHTQAKSKSLGGKLISFCY